MEPSGSEGHIFCSSRCARAIQTILFAASTWRRSSKLYLAVRKALALWEQRRPLCLTSVWGLTRMVSGRTGLPAERRW